MKLLVPLEISKKINWWLRQCKKEWSGVAYYRVKEYEENKLPKLVELVYFHVLDIGSHSSTEWDSDILAKAQHNFLNREDIDVDDCFQGLIHSHNSMEAFVSSTDAETLIEHAPKENFYFSFIVGCHETKCTRLLAVSYTDQYGFANWITAKEIEEDSEQTEVPQAWLDEIKMISDHKEALEAAKKAAKTTTKEISKTSTPFSKTSMDYINQQYSNWEQEDMWETAYGQYYQTEPDDLDDIDTSEFIISDEDEFDYEDERVHPYTESEKLKILAIRFALLCKEATWNDAITWARKHDINIMELQS